MDKLPWFEEFRNLMPVAAHWAYFDHAAVAPLPLPTAATLKELTDDFTENGVVNWSKWRNRLERIRTSAAELINADRMEIAFIRNTTEGVSIVAEGFPWQAGDNVVVPDSEFPSNMFPWLNLETRGVEVRRVPCVDERLDLDQLADACNERTRIVAASWVGFATGWRNDVAALSEVAHANNAYFFLDAIQGLGIFPLDVVRDGIDFLAADGHKWLLGPEGAGVFYLKQDHLELLRPLGVGWNSVKDAGDFCSPQFHLKEHAGRYEGGSYNMPGINAFGSSLDLLSDLGITRISDRVLELTDQLCHALEQIGAVIASDRSDQRKSGIVAFEIPDCDPQILRKRCQQQNVVISYRAGRNRVSPHAYNNSLDLERLIAALTSN